ncbi:hypothetical protein A0H81_06223 [Grifola frondosa]|uniref:Uncharacterized protein n=1 Tax=Grifola frondosa TaxID=5627 RepID=A0A1C7MB38_GRIFR|nr:hypothetical protein A0H81_06223 [Grifola frondosa]
MRAEARTPWPLIMSCLAKLQRHNEVLSARYVVGDVHHAIIFAQSNVQAPEFNFTLTDVICTTPASHRNSTGPWIGLPWLVILYRAYEVHPLLSLTRNIDSTAVSTRLPGLSSPVMCFSYFPDLAAINVTNLLGGALIPDDIPANMHGGMYTTGVLGGSQDAWWSLVLAVKCG